MQVYRDLSQLPPLQGSALTIGSFDGVHSGHRQILEQVQQLAHDTRGPSLLLTFHPHPRLALGGEAASSLRLLTTLDEKLDLLAACGLDAVVVIPFTRDFSAQSPEAYIRDFLVAHFHPRHLVIGYDHRFGQGRQGDIHYLRQRASDFGYQVHEISPQTVEDITISSTKIRKALEEGAVAKAARWLGHPFVLSGQVVHGLQLGRQLGFPTANLQIEDPHKLIPPEGIYAVRVRGAAEQPLGGMLYIGRRPTVQEGLAPSIEVNIFDFEGSLYGKHLRLDFLEYLRGDMKFEDLPALQAQIRADEQAARRVLAQMAL